MLREQFEDSRVMQAIDAKQQSDTTFAKAGWHLSTGLVVPPNITIMALPPKCPELNPVENVWQFLRDNWLSNRVFKSYDDLVDHCCAAWNKLVDQPGASCPSDCANGRTGSDQWDSVLAAAAQDQKEP
jgi:hypothetical protein